MVPRETIFAYGIGRPTLVAMMFLFGLPASAGEVRIECASVHPEKTNVGLDYGECLPDGEGKWVHVADETIDHGNNIFTAIDIHKTPNSLPLRKAKLECKYKDRSVILMSVPGELLRCGIKYRLPLFLGAGPDGKERVEGEWRVFAAWAISEVEDAPKPPK